MTVNDPRHGAHPAAGRIPGKRWLPFASAATAAVLTFGAVIAAGGGSAGAASAPQAQSVGNFLDAALNGDPIDQLAKLEYARATSPGTQSTQNPLDVTVLNALELPLTGALQLPNLAGINLGAVNQVAVARHNGSAYGGSGAVANSGGVSVGGHNDAFPADASIDLCASALSGGKCGSSATDALGELKLNIGAVSGLAQTPKGYAKAGSTKYQIAGLNLQLGSPQLGALLGNLTDQLNTLLAPVTGALGPISTQLGNLFPSSCSLAPGALDPTLDLAGGAVKINVSQAAITVDVQALLAAAHADLNHLPANTDLVKFLVKDLSDILTNGLGGLVNGLLDTLKTTVSTCLSALGPLAQSLGQLLTTLQGTVTTLTGNLGDVLKPITDAVAPLLDALGGLIDIGVNVQPNGPDGDFATGLDATPKQGTEVVAGQTIVRAIEVDVLTAGNVNLPRVQRKAAARKASNPLVALALGNAAAGPGAPPAPSSSPTPSPSTSVPATNVPTGVPAGMGEKGGTPALPIALLALAGLFAAGGAVAFKFRGRLNGH